MPDGIGFYRYQGFSLEEKIGWMRQGGGSAALAEAQAALSALGGDLVESEQNLRDLVNRLGGAWQGSAGTKAGEAMKLAAAWSADSAPAADEAWSQVGLQSESVDRTRYGMPGAAPRPEYGFGDAFGDVVNAQTGNLFDIQTDFDEQVAARRAADEEANRLLYAHEAASRANLAALPALPEVPTITVDAAPPPTICPPVVPDQDTVTPPPELHQLTEERRELRHQTDDKPRSDKDDRPGQVEPQGEQSPQSQPAQSQPTKSQLTQSGPTISGPTQSGSTQSGFTQSGSTQPGLTQSGLTQSQLPYTGGSQVDPRAGGVSAASYVPEPQTGQSLPGSQNGYRGSAPSPVSGPTAGFGGDTTRGPLGGGPMTGATPTGSGGPAGVPARGGVAGTGRGSTGLFGQPGAHADGDEDTEHSDKYYRGTDEIFRVDDLPALDHSVLGADGVE